MNYINGEEKRRGEWGEEWRGKKREEEKVALPPEPNMLMGAWNHSGVIRASLTKKHKVLFYLFF